MLIDIKHVRRRDLTAYLPAEEMPPIPGTGSGRKRQPNRGSNAHATAAAAAAVANANDSAQVIKILDLLFWLGFFNRHFFI